MDFNLEKTTAAWNYWINQKRTIPDSIEGVRQEIVDSWKRSQGKVDPYDDSRIFVDSIEFQKRCKENALLIEIAYPYLTHFSQFLSGTDYLITLTDQYGCQLKRICNNQMTNNKIFSEELADGCIYTEESIGTNGIGICLALKKPVMVLGPEHFHHRYHDLACYGAPIYDSKNKLIGCINITSMLSSYNPLIMGMLLAAINGIEREFELSKYNNRISFVVESFDNGILLLDENLKIINYNKMVLDIININKQDIDEKNINQVFSIINLPNEFQDFSKEISNIDCTIQNIHNQFIDISLSVIHQNENIYGIKTIILKIVSQKKIHQLTNKIAGFTTTYTFDSMSGHSQAIKNIKKLGRIFAGLKVPILIIGEVGTGKTMLAQAIHNESEYKDGPFISVHCGNLLKVHLEDELWGQEGYLINDYYNNGKPGKLELADGGTMLLQDIDNMSLDTQRRFYEFLKTKIYIRNGSKTEKKIDAQIIVSSKKNLLSLVENKMFRSDLFYLLNLYNIHMPPLRERKEDIIAICNDLIDKYQNIHLSFEEECKQVLMNYQWPGNILQLESVLESAVNLARGSTITISHLPLDIVNERYIQNNNRTFLDENMSLQNKLLQNEVKEYNKILSSIKQAKGNVKIASQLLKMSISTLYRKMSKYEINPKDYKE